LEVGWGSQGWGEAGEVVAELDVGTGVLAVEDFVADTNFWSLTAAVLVGLARSDLNYFTDLRLFLSGVGQKDAASSFFF
jgi:hypothetical protein